MSQDPHARKVRSSRPWARTVSRVLRTKGTVCHLCGVSGSTSADHVVPVAFGGTNELANLEPCHPRFNTLRGTLSVGEARAKLRKQGINGATPQNGYWHSPSRTCCPHSENWSGDGRMQQG